MRDTSGAVVNYQGAMPPLLRDSKRAGRQISRMGADTQVRLAAIDDETNTTIAKGRSLSSATAFAMSDVGQVAQVRREVETIAPEASGYLAMLASAHAMGEAELLADHKYQLRRK